MKHLILTLLTSLQMTVHGQVSPALISVQGSAEVSVEPNMIQLQIESWAKSAVAEDAQKQQADQYKKIQAVIEKFKVTKDDFKSQNFNISPEYVYDQKTQNNKINGYRVSHYINVTLKKIDEAGNFIDALVSAGLKNSGGVSIQSIHWDSSKKSDFEKQALEIAVKRARIKAEILADAANTKIKRVYKISHYSSENFAPPAMQMEAMSAMKSSRTELAPGQIKLKLDVSMDFEIQ